MRVVAGRLRGRALTAPPGMGTRPTADRVRQALFDVLSHAPFAPPLQGARVMDLFAGSGALGIEALSRGAAFSLFVETDELARGAIRTNLDALGLIGAGRVHRRDATDLGQRPASDGTPFDLAFLDPPYDKGLGAKALGERALAGLLAGGWLAPGAIAVLERGADEPGAAIPGFELLAEREWGPARVLFLRAA
jgi:16S rRNA (guanine966-N2)-methyltransferase